MSTPDSEGHIVTRTEGTHILAMGIDRPAKMNGFTPSMMLELAQAYTRLEQDDNLRVGVVYAEGAHFTAGLDLPKFAPLMKEGRKIYPPGLIDPFSLYPPYKTKPVIFAVKGVCFTLGIEMMLAADIVVAADNCRFAQIEVKRGIMPTGGATVRMVERAGWGNAQRYLLTGDEFGAAEAFRLGFVQEVVALGQELPRALQLAATIAEQAPLAVRASLKSSRVFTEHGPTQAIHQFLAEQAKLAGSADAVEGIASFVERRKASFTGQ